MHWGLDAQDQESLPKSSINWELSIGRDLKTIDRAFGFRTTSPIRENFVRANTSLLNL